MAISVGIVLPVTRNILRNPGGNLYGGFLPSDLGNLAAWYRFNQGITVTGSGVSQWGDQSGNGRHLLQSTDAARPSKESDGSILFDGAAQFLQAAFTLNQPETVYALVKIVNWASAKGVWDGLSGNSMRLFTFVSSPRVDLYAGAQLVNTTAQPNIGSYDSIAAVYNSASSLIEIGGNIATGDVGTNNGGGVTLGQSGGFLDFSNVQFKEFIVYSAAHDAATRAKIISYLNTL